MEGPTLARPYPFRIFYIKTEWSKYEIGEVLMQECDSVEARKAEAQEESGVK